MIMLYQKKDPIYTLPDGTKPIPLPEREEVDIMNPLPNTPYYRVAKSAFKHDYRGGFWEVVYRTVKFGVNSFIEWRLFNPEGKIQSEGTLENGSYFKNQDEDTVEKMLTYWVNHHTMNKLIEVVEYVEINGTTNRRNGQDNPGTKGSHNNSRSKEKNASGSR